MIPITKPFLPPRKDYNRFLDGIWKRNWLTNNGPLVNELELQLKQYLDLPHLLFVGNGTIALQIAIKALALKGEIVTTPFSYVATTSSIIWEGCQPVFVDIDAETFNIDPLKIEAAITPKTKAILATHCFGNPCEIDAIQEIADRHKLKVIYDAAHCFGTTYKDTSVYRYGDISTASFHATKLFHTVEGGAVISETPQLIRKMALMRNFGHIGPNKFGDLGINGKNSEFHAAMGLANLKYVKKILSTRKWQYDFYRDQLNETNLKYQKLTLGANVNYSYFPIVFENEQVLLKVLELLNQAGIGPRRYFNPSLDQLDYLHNNYKVPVSNDISKRILCLPMYYDLSKEEIHQITRYTLRILNNL